MDLLIEEDALITVGTEYGRILRLTRPRLQLSHRSPPKSVVDNHKNVRWVETQTHFFLSDLFTDGIRNFGSVV